MPSLNELGRMVKAKHPEYGDLSDLAVGRKVKAKYGKDYPEFSGAQPEGVAKLALDALPMAGGVVGGILGGAGGTAFGAGVGGVPGAMGGAAVGGAGGEAAKQLLERAFGYEAPATGAQAATDIGAQGLIQGAAEGGGQALAAGAKLVGKPMMELALKSTPEVAQTAIQEGITATKKGMETVLKRMGETGANTLHYVQQATRMGQRYDGIQFARNVMAKAWPEATDRPIPRPMQRKIIRLTKQFLGQNPASVTPERLHVMKKAADDLAEPIYARMNTMNPPNARETMEANWYKAFADHAREVLNTTIPDYEASNARNESLIKLKEAVWPRAKKQLSLGAQVASEAGRRAPGALTGALVGAELPGDKGRNILAGAGVGALAGTPQIVSKAALSLNNPMVQMMLRQSLKPLTLGAASQ